MGFREWIFSEKSGALGRFAAATEYAFGTISQRTLTHPARIRLHYGHPDLFNKMFVMTRGGISKATRQLHLTEDVFCGCNHTLRGGRIRYKEYISCGKVGGRDTWERERWWAGVWESDGVRGMRTGGWCVRPVQGVHQLRQGGRRCGVGA